MDNETNRFRTPDEVAAEQTSKVVTQDSQPTPLGSQTPSTKSGWRQKLHISWPPSKKEWLAIAGVVLLIGSLGTVYALTHQSKPAPVAQKVKKVVTPPAPKTVASNLSGMQVDPAINQRAVTGVMIENSLDSRPQSGLSQASVVFEAIAEGGITRFLALYQDNNPADVGPIRSARPYYLQWALGFDAGYAHVGGSPEALQDIKIWGVKDLDQFGNSGSYHRVSSRAAPHNVYTAIDTLIQLQAAKGYTSSTYTSFIRKKPAPVKVPTAKTVDLALSGPLYNVHYDYVAANNTYNRVEGGAAHIDANTNAQISPNVVVAMIIPYGIKSDGVHSDYATIGSGPVYIFQDGAVTTGQWTKISEKSQITFTDAAGKPIPLNPGQTWLTAVSLSSKVTYAP